MPNEITVMSRLQVIKGNLKYVSPGQGFSDNMAGNYGMAPGLLVVPTTGLDVDFTALASTGWCEMTNLDPTNFVEVGTHDGAYFTPFMELPPGKPITVYLSRHGKTKEAVPGTGSTPNAVSYFLRAFNATCRVQILAFER